MQSYCHYVPTLDSNYRKHYPYQLRNRIYNWYLYGRLVLLDQRPPKIQEEQELHLCRQHASGRTNQPVVRNSWFGILGLTAFHRSVYRYCVLLLVIMDLGIVKKKRQKCNKRRISLKYTNDLLYNHHLPATKCQSIWRQLRPQTAW